MISLSGAVTVIMYLVIGGIVFGLLDLLIRGAPMPDSWKPVARWVLLALAIMVLIGVLISLAGGGGIGPIFRP